MDVSTFKRDPERVKRAIARLGDKTIAKETLTITIPEYFTKRGLAEISSDIYIVAIYAIHTEDGFYANSCVPSQMRTEPSKISKTKIGGLDYYVFTYEPGATIVASNKLKKNNQIAYPIFNDILGKGNIPWQMDYDDVCNILAHAKQFANTDLAENWAVMDVFVSLIARDPQAQELPYRQNLKSFEQLVENPPVWSVIRSVQLMASSTLNKLSGAYFSDGVVSSLITETERTSKVEEIYRS